jgi:hypothetical protein
MITLNEGLLGDGPHSLIGHLIAFKEIVAIGLWQRMCLDLDEDRGDETILAYSYDRFIT